MAARPGAADIRLPTPITDHLREERFKDVYEPSEDSFLLMDALQQDVHTLQLLQPTLVLEMGQAKPCGSGCVTSFLAALLQHLHAGGPQKATAPPVFFVVDRQPGALEATRLTVSRNVPRAALQCIEADLFSAFRGRPRASSTNPSNRTAAAGAASCASGEGAPPCQRAACHPGPFDVILFNPPYVPGSPRAAVASADLPWWGGTLGREVTDKFVDNVLDFLSSEGILYLLLERRNKPEEVTETLKSQGCKAHLVASRRIRGETLSIWRFSRIVYPQPPAQSASG